MKTKRFNRAVIAGKFYPPHLGHNYLIDAALAQSNHVDVLVVDNERYEIPATKRQEWLQAHHPRATVHIIPDIEDDDNSVAWAAHTMRFLGYKPDAVFSSEDYGDTWAQWMGAKSIVVDKAREAVPISGTKVREDMFASWRYLSNEVKAGMALRVVVVGAESTGTTTLARDLAQALHTEWVPEIGRYYTASIQSSRTAWTDADFYRIGRLQQQYERSIAERSNGLIVCDTNATATELWQRRYMGRTTAEMRRIAAHDTATLYIITGDEIPFVQDGIRDGEHIRHRMHTWFETRIRKTDVAHITVRGNREQRLATALSFISNRVGDTWVIGTPL